MIAPTLHTERLTLRSQKLDDFPAYAAIVASNRARYMGGPLDSKQAWSWFCCDMASWAFHGFGSWTITKRAHDIILGFIGIQKPPHFPEIEFGWMATPEAEGKGHMFEATKAARDWAFDTAKLNTFVSYIDPANTRSIALATRLGAAHDPNAAVPEGEKKGDTLVYRHKVPA